MLSDWTVIIYPWISGDSSLTGMTDEQWKQVRTIFKRIHQVMLPPVGFESLRKETFDPREYTRWVRAFETQYAHTEGGGAARRALCSSWVAHQSTIQRVLTFLEKLAGVLQSRTFSSVICHGDLHARNLIRDRAGQVFVIDWDEVMLAPKERDFIFVRHPHTAAFFQGYGQAEIDWRYTANHIGHFLTITLDGKVLESAVILSAINGRGKIVGNIAQQQAQAIVATLRHGSLPVELKQQG